MATQSSDVEILVHVNAPSLVTSDATYRQLAQAYLAFEPSSHTNLSAHEVDWQGADSDQLGQVQPQNDLSSSQELVRSSQVIVIDSQDLSFQSALDNRSSPALPTAAQHTPNQAGRDVVPSSQPDVGASQKSWSAPPSQISDSYPMPNAAVYISPTRVLQRFVNPPIASARRHSSPSSSRDLGREAFKVRSSLGPVDVPSSLPDPSSGEAQGPQTGDVNAKKVVPVTPLAPTATKRYTDAENFQDDSVWDITHVSGSDVSVHPAPASSPRAGSEPPPNKKVKTADSPTSAAGDGKTLIRSSSDTGTATARQRLTPHPSHLDTLEIRPPSPPVGIDTIQPANLVSEKLAKLAVSLSSRYRPDARRHVQPLERGYWLLDCTTWSVETRAEAWACLTKYLEDGLAGWGVWCRRDAAHAWIRLYCWGHIAKHTYLLLYLVSGRHLKLTGAEWRDADGEVALKVPPHETPA